MAAMRVALVQLSYGDDETFDARVERVCALVAAQSGHDLVVLPELWAPTGFGYRRWAEQAQPVGGPWSRAMADAARAASTVLHAGSFVERLPEPGREGHELANTSVVFGPDGALLAWYRKVHRFGFGAGEPAMMEAGTEVPVVRLPVAAGAPVPVGLSTCYDLRFPEVYRRQVEAGAEVFVIPAAWPAARAGHWTLLGRARAVENQCVVVQCNTAGTHAGVEMGGRSQVVTATGEVLAEASAGTEEVLSVDLDLAAIATYRDAFPVLRDRRL
jgi:predicted amidohydrolase